MFRLCNPSLQLLTSAYFLSSLLSGYDFLRFPVRHREQIFEMNWWRVLRYAVHHLCGAGGRHASPCRGAWHAPGQATVPAAYRATRLGVGSAGSGWASMARARCSNAGRRAFTTS